MTHLRLLLFSIVWCCCSTFWIKSVNAQECNDELMRRCRRDGLNAIDSSGRQTSRNSADDQCKTLRENFDCILWQTSMCQDKDGQDGNRDSIVRIWRYLQSFCESQGSWYTKQCYQRDDLKRCELLLPSRGHSTDYTSCRDFASFRKCVTAIVDIDCSSTDRKLLGSYLMEKGQQRAWNCPRNQNDIYPASALQSADADLRFTSLSEASYGYCSDEARSELQDCRSEFYTSQKEAQTHNDSDMRHHKTCCAMVHFEDCVQQRLQERCGERSRSETRSIVSEMKERFPYQSCGDHTMTECSGAGIMAASFFFCFLFATISKLATYRL